MSPMMNEMLVRQVAPRLRNAARTIPKIGPEDDEEITQDATLMAARLMDSAERAGHPITAGNAAYYATRAARCGRRSYGAGRTDVLSPGCQIDGKARHEWLDEEIEFESGETGTLHDVIAPRAYQGAEADPSEEAARNLDWEAFLPTHPPRHRTVLLVLVEGGKALRLQGQRRDEPEKRPIAADLVAFFGEGVIRQLLDGSRSRRDSDLRASREQHLGRKAGGRETGATGVS